VLIPQGTRLVHIGPAKTGTTTLQSAFHHNRNALSLHGVRYAGPWLNVRPAVRGVSEIAGKRRMTPGSEQRDAANWQRLVADVTGAGRQRVVISSEAFAHCTPTEINTILDSFGQDKSHVVITMRPLGDMLASAWQQSIQDGNVMPYEEWLRGVLIDDPDGTTITPGFWRRTRIDRLAEQWGAPIGVDRVTIVSLAEQKRDFLLRTFEQMTGLPEGVLVPDPRESNLSMPYHVAEVFRWFNEFYRKQGLWNAAEHGRLVENGAMKLLKGAGPDAVEKYPFVLPEWAVDRSAEIMGQMNARLRELGVNVVGDLDALTHATLKTGPAAAPTELGVQDAARLVLAMMQVAKREGLRELHAEGEDDAITLMLRSIKREAAREASRTTASRERGREITGREALGILRRRVTARLRKS